MERNADGRFTVKRPCIVCGRHISDTDDERVVVCNRNRCNRVVD